MYLRNQIRNIWGCRILTVSPLCPTPMSYGTHRKAFRRDGHHSPFILSIQDFPTSLSSYRYQNFPYFLMRKIRMSRGITIMPNTSSIFYSGQTPSRIMTTIIFWHNFNILINYKLSGS